MSASTAWDEGPSVLASAWRYRWLLPVAVLLGGLIGYGLAGRQPTLYEGVSRVFVAQPTNPGQGGSASADTPARNVANQTQFLVSTPVLQQASRRYGSGMTAAELRKRLTVEAADNSDVITIRTLAPTAGGAAKLADAVALAYGDVITQNSQRQADVTLGRLHAEEARLRANLSKVLAALAVNRADPGAIIERDAINLRLRDVIIQELQAGQSTDASSGAVGSVERSAVPDKPARPRRAQLAAVGALLFLAAAVAMAWWRTWRQRTILLTTEPAASPTGTAIQLSPNSTQPTAALASGPNGARGGVERRRPRGLASDSAISVRSANAAANGRVPTAGHANGRRSDGRPQPEGTHVSAMTLTPESVLNYQQLVSSIEHVADRIEDYRLDLFDQRLPQVEADELAERFGLDLVAILLDAGEGRLNVAGGIGLTEAELQAEVDRDEVEDLVGAHAHVALDAERARLRELGCPGVQIGTLLVVPIGHEARYGVLLAGVGPDAESDRSDLSDQDVQEIAVFTRIVTHSLGAWTLLRHLRLKLRDVE